MRQPSSVPTKQWGIPAPVITAFWALESDFGSGMGKLPVLRSLTTLAYDCRRGDMFRAELLDALRIIDRGDLVPAEMIGSWAGELGQTQFLPSHYFKQAVDYDGDGRRNLMRSAPDIIASTSAFITSLGWQKGQPWLEEVRLPATMAWEQADLQTQHPRSHWAKAGITKANGQPLQADAQPASLLLLMGRNGPAFLAYPNFRIFTEWNQSLNYATTAAYLATRIAGAPPMSRGTGVVTPLNVRADQGIANAAGPGRLQAGRDRRQARLCDAGRRAAGPAQARHARGRVSSGRPDRAIEAALSVLRSIYCGGLKCRCAISAASTRLRTWSFCRMPVM